MNIATYITPRGFVNATGQGKHAFSMSQELAMRSDLDLRLLACREQLDASGRVPPGFGLESVPCTRLPAPSRVMHLAWRTLRWPPADFWFPDADWVYSPIEQFVPARRARTAATIHCVNWFEPDLPWSVTADGAAKRRRMEKVFRPIIADATVIVTVSEFLKGRICDLFDVQARRVAVVGNGAEEYFFAVGRERTSEEHAATHSGVLLAIAYPTQRKGFHYLLRLADALASRRSDLTIKIAGSGLAPGETLASAKKQWGSEVASLLSQAYSRRNIELLGFRQKEELADLLRECLAFVILSRYETFGIPVIEAMAAGVPVISASFAALPEIVGDAAWLVDAENSDEVARAAVDLANSRSLRRDYIQAGLQRAQQFTWKGCADRLIGALQSL